MQIQVIVIRKFFWIDEHSGPFNNIHVYKNIKNNEISSRYKLLIGY